jgi:KaiC/GvpD/RAD55 family RecA-like ATPase/transcription elongation factor Elf1
LSEILDYLDSRNINYRIEGSEAILKCPTCNKEKLSVNINSGVYQCFVCQAENPDAFTAKGHITQLKSYFGDIADISLFADKITRKREEKEEKDFTEDSKRYAYELFQPEGKKGLRYLLKRGFTQETIKKAELGFTRRYHQNWISIPAFEDGIVRLIKFRKVPPYEDECEIKEKCIREAGGKSILYNNEALKHHDEIIILEGEFDALMALQNGYENAVGVTVGAGTLKSDWYDALILKSKIYLCFDSDSAGQNAARNVWAERLGKDRCYNVELPDGMDVNDYFLKYKKENFNELLRKAYKFRIDGVKTLEEVFIEMYRRSDDQDDILSTPWESVNKLLERKRGLALARYLVLSGRAKSGKTTMAMQLCYHIIQNYKEPCLFICLEMPEVNLAVKLVQLHYGITYEEVSYKDAMIYANDLSDLPFYFGYVPNITPEIYYNTAKAVRDRFGVRVVVFDNIQLMVRTGKEEDMGQASRMFQMASRNLGILQILISQPRKTSGDDDLTADDLKGTSALQQDADYVVFVNRKRLRGDNVTNSFDTKTKLTVDMTRYSSGGSTNLNFLGEYSRFEEL